LRGIADGEHLKRSRISPLDHMKMQEESTSVAHKDELSAPLKTALPAEMPLGDPSRADNLDRLGYPKAPELVVGIVAPIGTPLGYFKGRLTACLKQRQFAVVDIKLSKFAALALEPDRDFDKLPAYERYNRLMSLGNDLRLFSQRDDILALFAAAEINAGRPETEPRHYAGSTFIVDQLKHPEEVFTLRKIYGDNFILVGLYCPKDIRQNHLEHRPMDATEAKHLIGRDEDEAKKFGQRVSDTFHLSDVFIEVTGNVFDPEEGAKIDVALNRFWDSVFGVNIVTPTRDEYGMYLAHSAGLRSSSLARQVGAAILSAETEVLSVGANDIPCYPGGLYWGDELDSSGKSRDARDHQLGFDESDRMKNDIVREILPLFYPGWGEMEEAQKERHVQKTVQKLKGTRVMSLTEFARAVHAEIEALSSAARLGVSVRGATLFSTTFPCHNCAKHIVASGIERVVYVEPYPKSRAVQMYGDSIYVKGESAPERNDVKVAFEPFVGIAPRLYSRLFGRSSYDGHIWEYKDKSTGELKQDEQRPRLPLSPLSYVIREGLAALDLKSLKGQIDANRKASIPAL
jgi:deoxycytidylate deaminase